MKDYYVYGHYDSQGNVFYIGKGTEKRAWKKERHVTWKYYVEKHLLNNYTVKIIRDNLTENEAEILEMSLILQYSKQLINWERPLQAKITFSPFSEEKFTTVKDATWLNSFVGTERFFKLRDANRKLISDSKILEITDIEGAIEGYRRAIKAIAEYCGYSQYDYMNDCLKKRINVEMEKSQGVHGEMEAINRLTMCLCKVSRKDEAKMEAHNYFSTYTFDYTYKGYFDIMKRVYKGEELPMEVLNTFKKRDEWLKNLVGRPLDNYNG